METLRLARATHQLLERGVEALEKIGRELERDVCRFVNGLFATRCDRCRFGIDWEEDRVVDA